MPFKRELNINSLNSKFIQTPTQAVDHDAFTTSKILIKKELNHKSLNSKLIPKPTQTED